jgi:transposase InsO family protein
VVIDLFARNVVGWSMKPTLSRELALDALMMAVWRRKPDGEVIVHSDGAASTAVTTGSASAGLITWPRA